MPESTHDWRYEPCLEPNIYWTGIKFTGLLTVDWTTVAILWPINPNHSRLILKGSWSSLLFSTAYTDQNKCGQWQWQYWSVTIRVVFHCWTRQTSIYVSFCTAITRQKLDKALQNKYHSQLILKFQIYTKQNTLLQHSTSMDLYNTT